MDTSTNAHEVSTVKSFEPTSGEQLESALAEAETCFECWKRKSYSERATVLRKAASGLREVGAEMGMDPSRAEVQFSADILDHSADHAESFPAPTKRHAKVGQADSPPLGVLFCVEPWNFPYYQLARVAGPQLMAGNVLVVRHAGSPLQGATVLERLLRYAGAPVGAYTNLFLSHEQADRVMTDPRIKGVALTGGLEPGRVVGAWRNLKKAAPLLSR